MIANEKIVLFISKLIEETKSGKVEWSYLDSNKSLCESIDLYDKITVSLMAGNGFKFDSERSFYYQQGNMYTVIYISKNEDLILKVVPNTYKNILAIYGDAYQSDLTRLLNTVKSTFPNPDDYIDSYLKHK